MVSATNSAPQLAPQSGELSDRQSSETGEFNFQDYLLGLQIGTANLPQQMLTDPPVDTLAEQTEKTLVSFFEKGDSSGNRSMFAGLENSSNGLLNLAPENSGQPLATQPNSILTDAVSDQEASDPNSIAVLKEMEQLAVEEQMREGAIRSYDRASTLSEFSETAELTNEKDSVTNQSLIGLSNAIQGQDALDGAGETVNESDRQIQASIPELFDRVQTLAHRGGGKMTVSLNPPHLGQMEIEVTTRGNKVDIEMTSDNEVAKTMLESQLGELKRSLETQDLNPSRLEVNLGSFGEESSMMMSNQNSSPQFSQQFASFQEGRSQSGMGNHQQTERGMGVAGNSTAATLPSGRVDIRI